MFYFSLVIALQDVSFQFIDVLDEKRKSPPIKILGDLNLEVLCSFFGSWRTVLVILVEADRCALDQFGEQLPFLAVLLGTSRLLDYKIYAFISSVCCYLVVLPQGSRLYRLRTFSMVVVS